MTPAVSVVVPLWNRAGLVGETIASIRGAHDGPFEVIVVDDGSTDGSAEAAEAALAAAGLTDRARVLRQRNAGPGAARNTGAQAARGAWLAFLDSDDLWFPWTLGVLARTLAGFDRPMLAFLQNVDFTDPATLAAVAEAPPQVEVFDRFAAAVEASVAGGRPIRFGAYAMPRDSFHALGGFSTALRCSEDLDFFLRGEGAWGCALLRAPAMIGYRTASGGNLSGNPAYLRDGLAHLRASERAGLYPPGRDGDPLRAALYADSALFAARIAFAKGRGDIAYGVLAAHAPTILRRRGPTAFAKIAATPALSLLRPRSFPFRLRPETAP